MQAMSAVYEFDVGQASATFSSVLDEEPECVMAYWGLALLALGHMYIAAPDERNLIQAGELLARKPAGVQMSARESEYFDMLSAYLDASKTSDSASPLMLLAEAAKRVTVGYPEDDNAKLLYAYALGATSSLSAGKLGSRQRAGQILEELIARNPRNPAALHLLLHNYDTQELAQRALHAADLYQSLSRPTSHDLHLPSHIYALLGRWEDVVETNRLAVATAKAEAQAYWPGKGDASLLHCLDFELYALLQLSRDEEAADILRLLRSYTEFAYETMSLKNARAAIPVRYVLERRAWTEAANLALQTDNGYPEAMIRYARLLGFARTQHLESAQRELEALTAVEAFLRREADVQWLEEATLLRLSGASWLALAQGHRAAARSMMEEARLLEAQRRHSVAMEIPISLVQEQLGDLLIELGDPKAAAAAYQGVLHATPNRLWSLYGLARAAELSGDVRLARQSYEQVKLLTSGKTHRAELRAASEFLAGQTSKASTNKGPDTGR
jgi:hypothetical protein